MTLIDADVFLGYLIFSKHIDSLKCKEVREAIEMSKVDVFGKIRAEIEECLKALDDIEKSGYNIYLPNEISGRRLTYQQCLEFIDKYEAAESEKNNGNDDKREST